MLRKGEWRSVTTPDVDAHGEGLGWACRMREDSRMNGKYHREVWGPEGKQGISSLGGWNSVCKGTEAGKDMSKVLLLAGCLPVRLTISH